MKELYLKWQQAFEQLSQRERLLIALSSFAIIGWLAWLPVESALKTLDKQEQKLKQLQLDVDMAQKLNISYQQALAQDPNQKFNQQLAELNERQKKQEAKLQAQVVDMVPAEEMPILLEQILEKSSGNKLLALESIAPTAILPTEAQVDNSPNLYRHGIKLKLSANYFDFLEFVKAIDAMPKKLYWQRLDYQVKDFPLAEIELELYSLSLSKEFIRVAQN